ncbi:Phosphoglucomutase-2, partial [Stegodyphus mimosarum]
MKKAFQYFRYENFIPVQEQMRPDPDFPTVKFPNPEEKNCLDLSIATADKHGSTLIFANDPDADRLAVAEKLNNGEWYIYSGNEIGAMLGSWLWDRAYKDLPVDLATQKRVGKEKCCMISSAVSSKILKSIAAKNKFRFFETLTGFKWMANKAYDWMQEVGNQFVFAFEEAIGFMCGPKVMDKDGIQAAMHMAQIAAYCDRRNFQLYDFLKEVYVKYGYHVSCNSYFICDNPDAITKFFEKLRNYKGQEGKYPERLEYFDIGWFEWIYFPVKDVRDLTTGYDSRRRDQTAVLPYGPFQQMITFYFENGCEMTLRTSGTEPKIKYYTEIISTKPESEWKKVDELLHKMVELLIEQWIQPEKNGFSYRP